MISDVGDPPARVLGAAAHLVERDHVAQRRHLGAARLLARHPLVQLAADAVRPGVLGQLGDDLLDAGTEGLRGVGLVEEELDAGAVAVLARALGVEDAHHRLDDRIEAGHRHEVVEQGGGTR